MTVGAETVILSASILNAGITKPPHIVEKEEEPEKNYPQADFLARR